MMVMMMMMMTRRSSELVYRTIAMDKRLLINKHVLFFYSYILMS